MNMIRLWYDGSALDAETLPDSALPLADHVLGDFPEVKQGEVLPVEFWVMGIKSWSKTGP